MESKRAKKNRIEDRREHRVAGGGDLRGRGPGQSSRKAMLAEAGRAQQALFEKVNQRQARIGGGGDLAGRGPKGRQRPKSPSDLLRALSKPRKSGQPRSGRGGSIAAKRMTDMSDRPDKFSHSGTSFATQRDATAASVRSRDAGRHRSRKFPGPPRRR